MLAGGDRRIGDGDAQFLAALLDGNAHDAAFRRRLDAVVDGVLQQRLQHQRRNRLIHGNRPDLPVDRKTLAKAQFFQFKVLLAEGDLVGQADQFAGVAHGGAKQVGQATPAPLRPAAAGRGSATARRSAN